jgi:hypothetical protein
MADFAGNPKKEKRCRKTYYRQFYCALLVKVNMLETHFKEKY